MTNVLYNPDRIKPVIELLQKRWEENPQMRLLQLVINIVDETQSNDLFYISDETTKKRLKEYNF